MTPKKNLYFLIETVDKKKNHYLMGKLNICLPGKKFPISKKLLIFPLNSQDKTIAPLRGLSKDEVTVTSVSGPCSIVIYSEQDPSVCYSLALQSSNHRH